MHQGIIYRYESKEVSPNLSKNHNAPRYLTLIHISYSFLASILQYVVAKCVLEKFIIVKKNGNVIFLKVAFG